MLKYVPYTILVKCNQSNLFLSRSTNVKMKHVRGQGVIVLIVPTRKTTHHVKDLDADTK